MKVSNKIKNKWFKLKDKGDVKNIATLLKKNPATISRIIYGKQGTTTDVIHAIDCFYIEKKQKRDAIKH